jgi:hypothetical protein
MYWHDAGNVLQDLDKFQALYVKYHGCVWSECSLDNYDDDGENRDGDEYWYQYRTLNFCANAAYSLYGQLKGRPPSLFGRCSKGTYINSFFTYGGADTLLRALDISTTSVFDDYGDDDNTNTHSNAVCYVAGGENNNNAMSSTMGCTKDGKFVAAMFADDTCDGNYFVENIDSMTSYNRKANGIGCKQIWNLSRDGKNYDFSKNYRRRQLNNNNNNQKDDDGYTYVPKSAAEALFMNSWACSSEMYGKYCPDPYGLKAKYDDVLYAVSSGRSAQSAILYYKLKTPLSILTWLFTIGAVTLWSAAYFLQNRELIRAKGLFPVLLEDLGSWCTKIPVACAACGRKFRECFRYLRKIRRRRKKREMSEKMQKRDKKKKKRRSKSNQEPNDDKDGLYSTALGTFSSADFTESAPPSAIL